MQKVVVPSTPEKVVSGLVKVPLNAVAVVEIPPFPDATSKVELQLEQPVVSMTVCAIEVSIMACIADGDSSAVIRTVKVSSSILVIGIAVL